MPELDRIRFLSHGTLEACDLEKTRKFYAECLGLEVMRTSPISLMIRLGGNNTIAVVQNPKRKPAMPLLNHNGLDVETRDEVNTATRCSTRTRTNGASPRSRVPPTSTAPTRSTSRPRRQLVGDLTNPPGGYAWMFSQGSDLKAWGAGDGDQVNPNAFKQGSRS